MAVKLKELAYQARLTRDSFIFQSIPRQLDYSGYMRENIEK